jgi:hypothetical protein
MERKLYYPQNGELIILTYANSWVKEIKYVEKSYSSFMGSYVVFCIKLEGDKEKPISLYHDDEKIIDMIIESAIINNYIDLANYYSRDAFSINEQVSQKHD